MAFGGPFAVQGHGDTTSRTQRSQRATVLPTRAEAWIFCCPLSPGSLCLQNINPNHTTVKETRLQGMSPRTPYFVWFTKRKTRLQGRGEGQKRMSRVFLDTKRKVLWVHLQLSSTNYISCTNILRIKWTIQYLCKLFVVKRFAVKVLFLESWYQTFLLLVSKHKKRPNLCKFKLHKTFPPTAWSLNSHFSPSSTVTECKYLYLSSTGFWTCDIIGFLPHKAYQTPLQTKVYFTLNQD